MVIVLPLTVVSIWLDTPCTIRVLPPVTEPVPMLPCSPTVVLTALLVMLEILPYWSTTNVGMLVALP